MYGYSSCYRTNQIPNKKNTECTHCSNSTANRSIQMLFMVNVCQSTGQSHVRACVHLSRTYSEYGIATHALAHTLHVTCARKLTFENTHASCIIHASASVRKQHPDDTPTTENRPICTYRPTSRAYCRTYSFTGAHANPRLHSLNLRPKRMATVMGPLDQSSRAPPSVRRVRPDCTCSAQ